MPGWLRAAKPAGASASALALALTRTLEARATVRPMSVAAVAAAFRE
jgi:hypothetical protein